MKSRKEIHIKPHLKKSHNHIKMIKLEDLQIGYKDLYGIMPSKILKRFWADVRWMYGDWSVKDWGIVLGVWTVMAGCMWFVMAVMFNV